MLMNGKSCSIPLFYSKATFSNFRFLGIQNLRNFAVETSTGIFQELLVHLEKSASYKEVTGAVLIFLPGLADITELYEILQSDQRFNDARYMFLYY